MTYRTAPTSMNFASIGRKTLLAGAVALAFGAASAFTGESQACGGLFCDSQQPVNQAAERIIFAKNDNGTVTAAIEIQYEGDADSFAWVLPVPAGETEVGVSSINAFDMLDQRTNPVYQLRQSFDDDDCGFAIDDAVAVSAESGSFGDDAAEDEEGEVLVVAEGNAGPYDWVQIDVSDDLDDPADAAVMWLTDNGFDVTDIGPDLLRVYLDDGMNLIAFRLSSGRDAGSIRPVMLTYESELPFIPIRPTAVAAMPDLGIRVYVLGASRAVPDNYRHLELNQAMINWFDPNPTYNDVVIAAADEAGGQGFVTEMSGPAGEFADDIYPEWQQDWFSELQTGRFESLQEFFLRAQGYFSDFDGFTDVMLDPEVVPLREGATHEQFLSCIECYFDPNPAVQNAAFPETPYPGEEDPIHGIDVTAFLEVFELLVITPLEATQALFEDNAMVTRFYTTLSPDEMTTDPIFDFNPDLPDVDNLIVAEQILHCSDDGWTIRLPQGMEITGSGRDWPVDLESDFPVNLRVVQLSTDGEGEVVTDNAAMISGLLTDLDIGEALPQLTDPDATPDDDDEDGEASADDSSGGGCHVATNGPANGRLNVAWLLLALPWLRRRSRQQRR